MSAAVDGRAAVRERAAPARPVVAMVGAGQLARMTHQAAIALGVEVRVLASGPDEPAAAAGAACVLGSPERLADLRRLAAGADVVTYDHERVDPQLIARLEAEDVRFAPGAAAKLLAQDKAHMRRTLARLGFPVPPFALAHTPEDVAAFAAAYGWPLVAKPPRGGYDGRGVFPVPDAAAARRLLDRQPGGLLVEPRVTMERELAVLVARSTAGETRVYPVVETVQQEGMCREIVAPAPIPADLRGEAESLALRLAERIGATGVVAVELFLAGGQLLVNELALRPHNSGHSTIEGCTTSQFEQHLRAILGWPLGSTSLRAPAVVTVNVVGPQDGSDPAERIAGALGVPGAHVHLYGKEARPGRKLGHVTVLADTVQAARAVARRAASILEGRAW